MMGGSSHECLRIGTHSVLAQNIIDLPQKIKNSIIFEHFTMKRGTDKTILKQTIYAHMDIVDIDRNRKYGHQHKCGGEMMKKIGFG